MKRRIGAVSVARSDYGLYTPVFDEIMARPGLELGVVAAAAHLSPRFGHTVDQIVADGYPVVEKLDFTPEDDSPAAIAQASGRATELFAQAFDRQKFDLLLLLGDRYEMHAAGVAAVPMLLPLAHIHGGEETTGAIDNVYRHSLTKISHLHFASTASHARRILQMGEEEWRVTVSGAPAIDRIMNSPRMPRAELESVLGHSFPEGSIVATFHPVTTEPGEAEHQTQQFLDALRQFGRPVLLTMPNADPGGLAVRRIVARFAEEPWLHIHENLGQKLYVAVMANAGLMAGNSSSGIIEAASFDLPVVNVGDRQQGRERSGNVIDSPCTTEGVLEALHLAVGDPSLGHHPNIYGDGKAARRIVEVLSSVELGPRLIKKPFVDR